MHISPPAATVVALHGQPGDAAEWAAVATRLPSDLRFLALDRPGYGANRRPAGTIAENAEWLVAELAHAGISDATLVGHSYGGGVAIAAAVLAPERVSSLVLIASIGPGAVKWWDRVLAARLVGPAIAYVGLSLLPNLARRLAPRWVESGRIQVYDAPWRSFVVEQRELVANLSSVNAMLSEIAVPTLIVVDPADSIVPVATSNELRRAIPHARLEVVDGGHSLPSTNPDAVAAAIESAAILTSR